MAIVNPQAPPAAPQPQTGQTAKAFEGGGAAGGAQPPAPCPNGGVRGPDGKCAPVLARGGGGGQTGPLPPPAMAQAAPVLGPGGAQPNMAAQPHAAGAYALQGAQTAGAPPAGAPQGSQQPQGAPVPGQPPAPAPTGGSGANAAGVNADTVVDYALKHIDSTISKQEWESYRQYFDPSCPPGTPYKSRKVDDQGAPLQGCNEKPDNCPEGQIAFGEHKCLPTGDPRVRDSYNAGLAGGGAGGAGGGMGGAGGYGLSQIEKKYMSSLTSLADQIRKQSADLYRTGNQDYKLASDRFRSMAGVHGRAGVQEATAPAAEQISAAYKGAEAGLSGLRGADLAAAKAELARGKAGDIGGLAAREMGAATAAMADSGKFGVGAGMQGQSQAAGIVAGQQQSVMQSRLTEEGYQNQWNIASLNADVSREGIAAQKEMATAQLSQSADQFMQRLLLDTNMFNEQMRQFNLNLDLQKDQIAAQNSSQKSSFWGGLAGTVIGGGATIGAAIL